MKKKSAQCPRQGKSNTNIKNFLNNLKENDLHFDDDQITQCVFLGVLRLKPVPSVFASNNVPSVVVEHKSKRYKNNNCVKEINKNISQKNEINKVISGKITKKNPDRIKASVKKLPTKRPVIKVKFNIGKHKKESQKNIASTPEALTSQTMFQNKTVTLNPISTTPSFNPVQNLFDKLKQQMDEKYSRPTSSDISKEILFSSELNVDDYKAQKKSKKANKKKTIYERLVMPLLPSHSSSFSDNGYFSSTSTINTKSGDDVIIISEDNGSDCEEVMLNTGPMPNFVLEDNESDIILIDDASERNSPNRDLLVDDIRSIRSSPRINRNDQNIKNIAHNIQQKNSENVSQVINLEDNTSQTNSSEEQSEPEALEDSKQKPRKRRTLLPSIPSIFFNTPMLLRSELAQKKSGHTESKPTSKNATSKLTKPQKQEKLPLKQRKEKPEVKSRTSTENLIYEVVKSSTGLQEYPTENINQPQNDVIFLDNSPPKVEPLIIKLKVSQTKAPNEKSQEGNGVTTDMSKDKNKLQDAELAAISKNLFLPRLLRSDVNQQKTNKEDVKKSTKLIENSPVSSAVTSPGKLSVKRDSFLKEGIDTLPRKELFTENSTKNIELTSQKNAKSFEKPAEKLSSNTKKTEKSHEHQQRKLRSVIVQENSDVHTDGLEKSETNVVCIKQQNFGVSSCQNQIKLPGIEKKIPEVVDKITSIQEKTRNIETSNLPTTPKQVRSSQDEKQSEEKHLIINVDLTPEQPKVSMTHQIDEDAEAHKHSNETEVIHVSQFYPTTNKPKSQDSMKKSITPQIVKENVIKSTQIKKKRIRKIVTHFTHCKQLRSNVAQRKTGHSGVNKNDENISTIITKDATNNKHSLSSKPLISEVTQKNASDVKISNLEKIVFNEEKVQLDSNKIKSNIPDTPVHGQRRSDISEKEEPLSIEVKTVNPCLNTVPKISKNSLKNKKSVPGTLNLDIDLVGYEDHIIDTTTPRQLRSDLSHKKNHDSDVNANKNDPVEEVPLVELSSSVIDAVPPQPRQLRSEIAQKQVLDPGMLNNNSITVNSNIKAIITDEKCPPHNKLCKSVASNPTELIITDEQTKVVSEITPVNTDAVVTTEKPTQDQKMISSSESEVTSDKLTKTPDNEPSPIKGKNKRIFKLKTNKLGTTKKSTGNKKLSKTRSTNNQTVEKSTKNRSISSGTSTHKDVGLTAAKLIKNETLSTNVITKTNSDATKNVEKQIKKKMSKTKNRTNAERQRRNRTRSNPEGPIISKAQSAASAVDATEKQINEESSKTTSLNNKIKLNVQASNKNKRKSKLNVSKTVEGLPLLGDDNHSKADTLATSVLDASEKQVNGESLIKTTPLDNKIKLDVQTLNKNKRKSKLNYVETLPLLGNYSSAVKDKGKSKLPKKIAKGKSKNMNKKSKAVVNFKKGVKKTNIVSKKAKAIVKNDESSIKKVAKVKQEPVTIEDAVKECIDSTDSIKQAAIKRSKKGKTINKKTKNDLEQLIKIEDVVEEIIEVTDSIKHFTKAKSQKKAVDRSSKNPMVNPTNTNDSNIKHNRIHLVKKIIKNPVKKVSKIVTDSKKLKGRVLRSNISIQADMDNIENQDSAPKETLKPKSTKKQQDLDEITVVTEKRNKKHKDVAPRFLRSSFPPIVIKKEPPAAVVEKVVALIHSEPKPKQYEEIAVKSETKCTEKIKPRISRSQNFNQIDCIEDNNKHITHPFKKTKKNNKKETLKVGVSEKSKAIKKTKKEMVAKKLRSDHKPKKNSKTAKVSKKEKVTVKKQVKAAGRSKIENLSKTSKTSVLKQVKSKLKSTKTGNPLKKSPVSKAKVGQKRTVDWRNDEIIERIIQELKNTIFNHDRIEDRIQKEEGKKNGFKKQAFKKGETKPAVSNTKFLVKRKKNITKSFENKIKVMQLAKKKILQTKAALKHKLRNASKESNGAKDVHTPGSSESKEDHPPKEITRAENQISHSNPLSSQLVKEETIVQIVDSYLEEVKQDENANNNKNDSIIILNEVTLQTNGEIVEKGLKRKPSDLLDENAVKKRRHQVNMVTNKEPVKLTLNVKQDAIYSIDLTDNVDVKKKDLAIFDFVESEPEICPLRHKSSKISEPSSTVSSSQTQTSPEVEEIIEPINENSTKRVNYNEISTRFRTCETQTTPIKQIFSNRNEKRAPEIPRKIFASEDEDMFIPKFKPLSKLLSKSPPSEIPFDIEKRVDDLNRTIALNTLSLESRSKKNRKVPAPSNSSSAVELSGRKSSKLVPHFDNNRSPKKLWSVIDESRSPEPLFRPPVTRPKTLEVPSTSTNTTTATETDNSQTGSPEKSPMKQPTIIEMFSKVWMKQEKPFVVKKLSTSDDNVFTKKQLPPQPPQESLPAPSLRRGREESLPAPSQRRGREESLQAPSQRRGREESLPGASPRRGREDSLPAPSPRRGREESLPAPSPRRGRVEDDDSDNESRIEWIPEEYAEYRFKYSAQKMMQYKPLFKCKICQIMMPSYYKLLKHRREHENKEKPYCCPQCGSEFKEVQDFSAHLRLHKGKHPYMCQKCDLGFWSKTAWEAHAPVHILKKAKPLAKKFRCDVCSKEFSKLCDVERHTRVHTGEKPCICNICNKRFYQAHNLSKHLLTHLHIKPFICEICNKQFGRNDVLRRHLLTHSVEKPVKCGVCFKGFIRHSQLLQHYKRKHPDENIDDLPQPFLEVDAEDLYLKNEANEDTEDEEYPTAQSLTVGE